MVFQQEGGLMGMTKTWYISAGGEIASEEDGICQVEPEAVADVIELAEEIGFFDMPVKEAPDICCDFFTFTLTIHLGDQSNTITVSEGDPNLSQEFRELLTSVQRVVYSCSNSGTGGLTGGTGFGLGI